MLKKLLLALGVVVTISALGMKIVKFSKDLCHILSYCRVMHMQSRAQSNACSRVRIGIGSGETESICVRFLTQRLSY